MTSQEALPVAANEVKGLEARLDLRAVIAISVSAMLGSGVFVLPGLAAGMAGPSVWIAYLLAGLCVLPAGLSKAELATAMPASGGTYVYVDRTFGPLAGTIVGLGLWLSLLLKSAFALDGLEAYLEAVVDVPAKLVGLLMLGGIVGLNVLGVRKVGKVQTLVVFTALVGLIVLASSGARTVQSENLTPLLPHGFAGLAMATAFVFVSYAGVTNVAAVAEEVRNPTRNLPLGMLLSLLIAMSMYGFVVFVLVGNVPWQELAGDLRPVHTLAGVVGGPALAVAAAMLGVVTMSAMANAGLLSASRFPFAMSRAGLLPQALCHLHTNFLTPVRCILLTGFVMGIVMVSLDVVSIAKLASAFILMIFMVENLAVIVLRETGVQWYKPSYRLPLYPLVPLAGILSTLALLWIMGLYAVVAGVGIAVPGALVFFLYSRRRTERLGVLRKLGKRQNFAVPSERATAKQAAVGRVESLVVLLGHERSPETLVEVGASLADGEPVRTLHVTEVPDQTLPEAVREDDAPTRSLRRRVQAMSEDKQYRLEFEAMASRDVVRTVHERTQASGCSWLVMGWRARSRGSLMATLPLGWLTQRLGCNIAVFHDAGVRYIREVVALVAPGPHDALVATTADHLAATHGAHLTLARFVPERTELPYAQAQTDYLDQLRGLMTVKTSCRLLRGTAEAETVLEESASYDLLVIGAAPEKRLLSSLRRTVTDRINEDAACSVLEVRTPRQRHRDDSVVRQRVELQEGFDLLDYVEERFLATRLRIAKKDALFDRFATTFAEALGVAPRAVVSALWERERTQNTSVGDGVAMPHATLQEADRLHLGVFSLFEPMEYDAIDGRPVDVFFVTIGPPSERQTHLRVLGAVAGLVLKTRLLDRLRAADEAPGMVRAIEVSRDEA